MTLTKAESSLDDEVLFSVCNIKPISVSISQFRNHAER